MIESNSTESLRELLAFNVKIHRQRLKMTQEEFAAHCGLHRTYIGAIERAERNVTLSTLEILSKALIIEASELLLRPKKNTT
jgi:transcriptional regulator with XRE-family HTH domain